MLQQTVLRKTVIFDRLADFRFATQSFQCKELQLTPA